MTSESSAPKDGTDRKNGAGRKAGPGARSESARKAGDTPKDEAAPPGAGESKAAGADTGSDTGKGTSKWTPSKWMSARGASAAGSSSEGATSGGASGRPSAAAMLFEAESHPQPYAAELVGTAVLVFIAVGSAVLSMSYVGTLGVALAFGFTLLALAYAIGPISGCHVNPAVTLGMLVAGRMHLNTAVRYWIAQVVGGIVGALLLFLVTKQVPGLNTDGAFGSNGFGDRSTVHINAFGAFVAEILLTAVLVYVVLSVTHRIAVVGFDGLPIGMALAVVHLIGIPLTGTSVNPARSIGPALFAGGGALTQLWLFIVAPLVGGVLAAVLHRLTHPQVTADETLANAEPSDLDR